MKQFTFTLFFGFFILICNAQGKNFIDQPYLEVSGNFDTLVIPDEIYIGIVISEKDTRDRISVEEQEAKMIAAFKAMGIDVEKNLSTKDMGSNFKNYILKGKEVIKTKRYILKVPDAATASKVFTVLESMEISNSAIYRISFSGINKLKNQARTNAVENAVERASALLKPLHQNLGPAIFIQDNENYNPSSQDLLGNRLEEVVVTGYSGRKEEEAETKIEFEKIRVTANVNVKFALK
jgi:uncharacterized protein